MTSDPTGKNLLSLALAASLGLAGCAIGALQPGARLDETREFGSLLHKKRIPNHIAIWGEEARHQYPWWQKQARHYLSQMF